MPEAATDLRPSRPIQTINGAPITIDMIRDSLARSEPGQGIMGMHIEDMYAYPFYTEWLLDRLAEATAKRPRAKPRKRSSPPAD